VKGENLLRITPLDIYQQEFRKVLRGLDPDEVEDFLERVADDYEQLIKENVTLKGRVQSLEAQLGDERMRGQGGEGAREEAGDIIREAKKEADNVIREARKEADNIIRKANASAAESREINPPAGEMPDEVVRREADLLLEEARMKANELMEKVKIEELALRREISRLRGQKERFLIEYRELLEKHLRILTEKA
jgi:cell division initiation protein